MPNRLPAGRAFAAALLLFVTALAVPFPAAAQVLSFTTVPPGYEAGSIALPRPFAGALASDPADPSIIHAAVGAFGDMDLARIELASGFVTIVADGPFASIGGIAVTGPRSLLLTENGTAPGGPPGESILILEDLNWDGDFDDPGEIESLTPILTNGGNFSGSQVRPVPPGNPSSIPSGAAVIQTADNNGEAELLVADDLPTTPVFRPAAGPYFTGFDYNGGFDFDPLGRIFTGSVSGTSFLGSIHALVNLNGDGDIDAGESHELVSGEGGMADLVIDAEGDVLFCSPNSSFMAAIRTFRVPADPLTGTASPADFAVTDAGFLSAAILTSKTLPFESYSGPGAVLLTSGFTAGFAPAENLMTLRPLQPNAARGWESYE